MTLVSQLEKIESSGLIRLAQQEPDIEYIFRHALVQDATYESLLKADRRTLHQAVGQTLENLYADRLDEIAATLALHFEKADELEKAVVYFVRAGDAATRIYAMDEAIELFGHALEIFPPTMDDETLTNLYSQYGRALELAGRFDAVLLLYEKMRADGISRQNLRMELAALLAQAILHATPSPLHNVGLATQLAERALLITRILEDLEAESRAYWILMLAIEFDGHLEEAITYGEQALSIAKTINNRERLAFTLNDIARAYISNRMMDKGLEATSQARVLWKELGNLPMLVDNLASSAEFTFFRGHYRECIALAKEAYEIATSIHNLWGQTICLLNMSFSHLELGEMDQAIQINKQLMAFDPRETLMMAQLSSRGHLSNIYNELGDPHTGHTYLLSAYEIMKSLQSGLKAAALAGMVQYYITQGNLAEAEKMFEEATENYNPQNFMTFIPQYVEAARNELLMYKGEFSAALESLDQLLATLDGLEIGYCRPEFLLRKARALQALARHDQAREVLESAAALGEKMEGHRMVWRIYSLLGDLQNESGDSALARESWASARKHIQFIADHAPLELKSSFLNLPEVSRLLTE